MCNFKHADSKVPRKKKGVGWKIFRKLRDKSLMGMYHDTIYKPDGDGWIRWVSGFMFNGDGFALLKRKKEIIKLFKRWVRGRNVHNYVICKVQYEDATYEHDENNVCDDMIFRIALVKKFKVLKELKVD